MICGNAAISCSVVGIVCPYVRRIVGVSHNRKVFSRSDAESVLRPGNLGSRLSRVAVRGTSTMPRFVLIRTWTLIWILGLVVSSKVVAVMAKIAYDLVPSGCAGSKDAVA